MFLCVEVMEQRPAVKQQRTKIGAEWDVTTPERYHTWHSDSSICILIWALAVSNCECRSRPSQLPSTRLRTECFCKSPLPTAPELVHASSRHQRDSVTAESLSFRVKFVDSLMKTFTFEVVWEDGRFNYVIRLLFIMKFLSQFWKIVIFIACSCSICLEL